jgi:hypothetical protein
MLGLVIDADFSENCTLSAVCTKRAMTALAMFQPCLLFLQANASNSTGGVHLWSQQAALLQWKSTLQSSPSLPLLDSWRPGTSPCSNNWTGVHCYKKTLTVTF